MDDNIKTLLAAHGIDSEPDFSRLVKTSVSSFSMLPKDNTWDESHMLQAKMDGLDFAAVCMKVLNVNSNSSYELGLVKVSGWRVVDTFHSYINPLYPISKALRKIMPQDLLQQIDEAPTLDLLWPQISHFFESNVLYGSEASTRRLIYCLDAYKLDISPVALPRGFGSQPEPVNILLKNGSDVMGRTALDYAVEWAASRIKSRIK